MDKTRFDKVILAMLFLGVVSVWFFLEGLARAEDCPTFGNDCDMGCLVSNTVCFFDTGSAFKFVPSRAAYFCAENSIQGEPKGSVSNGKYYDYPACSEECETYNGTKTPGLLYGEYIEELPATDYNSYCQAQPV